jgi:5-(carboxyamino)imidazole ribonucleotide synthase
MTGAPALRGPLPPGSTIGILGSGQLARMLILAATRLGLRCHVYADAKGPACDVAAAMTIAPYDDTTWLTAFASEVDVVTFEFENVPEATARTLAERVPVRPNPDAFRIAQDRIAEKSFIAGLGLAVAPFASVYNADEAKAALKKLAAPAILKTARLGYDGKGQASLTARSDAAAAWRRLGSVPCVLEKRLAFKQEVSVVLARGVGGTVAAYDSPQNTHAGGILRRSIVPAPLEPAAQVRARDIAARIAAALNYIGVLAVELFDLGPEVPLEHRLLVNEMAPRVHNSGHWTLDACAVSQFENQIRAVADWPLGDPARHSDAEMLNLIGQEANAWREIASEAGACLHLYGKREAREGRKMGHVTRLLPKGTRG